MKSIACWARCCAIVWVAAALVGCAHPIMLSSDLTKVTGSGVEKSSRKAGLLVTEANRQLEVTTPGGGGDKVRYFPYRDLESGMYVAMSEVFAGVAKVSSETDPKIKEQGLSFILSPTLVTNSSSPSAFTWPPTKFSIELTCKVVDAEGKAVTEVKASGAGAAEFEEFKSDFSLSAKRAAEDVLAKLVKLLAADPALR